MTRATRLSKQARREQLLDAAATLLVEKGLSALTMEGLAQAAGVSKALPYSHFDNAEATAVALYQREMAVLGTSVLGAVEAAGTRDDALVLAVNSFFSYVEANGELLSVIAGAGSPVPQWANQGTPLGESFVAGILTDHLDVAPEVAAEIADPFLGALNGSVAALARGAMSPARARAVSVQFLRGALDAFA